MSKMSNLDVLIQEATQDDIIGYEELKQEINSFLHGHIGLEGLSLKAITILEEAGWSVITDGENTYCGNTNTCPTCKTELRLEGEEKDQYYCPTCNKFWEKA